MDNECNGCTALIIGFRSGNQVNNNECKFTKFGIKSFKNCPCKTCVVKVICQNVCEDLANIVNTSRYRYSRINANFIKPSQLILPSIKLKL